MPNRFRAISKCHNILCIHTHFVFALCSYSGLAMLRYFQMKCFLSVPAFLSGFSVLFFFVVGCDWTNKNIDFRFSRFAFLGCFFIVFYFRQFYHILIALAAEMCIQESNDLNIYMRKKGIPNNETTKNTQTQLTHTIEKCEAHWNCIVCLTGDELSRSLSLLALGLKCELESIFGVCVVSQRFYIFSKWHLCILSISVAWVPCRVKL